MNQCGALEKYVLEKLQLRWSPRQISVSFQRKFPENSAMQISHEAIYMYVYLHSKKELKSLLISELRQKRKYRGNVRRGADKRTTIQDPIRIDERPEEVKGRLIPGHWEGDLIMGAGNASAIGTLVERATRFTILLHLPDDHTAESVATAMIAAMSELPAHLRRTITWDRGSEMAAWQDIALQLQAPVYFCDPHSPWQRGTNENTNRLLRFWFEKSTDLRVHTNADLKRIQDTLNKRPRPTLNLDTPADRLNALITQAAA
jgi:IS30 family transposase